MRLRIGIFSEDVGSSHAAAMVAQGLSRVGRAVTVVSPEFRPGNDLRAPARGGVSTCALPDRVNAFEVQSLLERSDLRGGDCVVALPLVALRERAIRIQFDAVMSVGRDQSAGERALGAARYDTVETVVWDAPPAWFLACGNQHELRTRANLRPDRGPGLPIAVRSLPATLRRLSPAEGTALLEGRPDIDTVRNAILLAVLVVAIAADPHARRLDAGTLTALMATRDLAGERETSDLLVRLANAYEGVESIEFDRNARRWAIEPQAERRAAKARSGPTLAVGRPHAGMATGCPDPVRRTS